MRRLQYLWAVFLIAARRLWHQRGLTVSMLLGLVAAVAFTVSIPIYADAISYRILNEKLYADADNAAPPFSFLFRYVGAWKGYLEWEACARIDQFFLGQAAQILGLPQEMLVRHFKTEKMQLFPASEATYTDVRKPLTYVSVGFLSDLEAHADLLDGRFPRPILNSDEPLEVLVSPKLVEELGVQVGEKYIAYYQEPAPNDSATGSAFQRPVRIVGVWQPRDENEAYWFYQRSAFDDLLLVPEASYVQMAQAMKGEVGLAVWSLVCNGDAVHAADARPLLGRIAMLRNKASEGLSAIDLVRSPNEALLEYVQTVQLITVVLYVFSLPILGVVLYFITLISAMIVRRQSNEIAMLRSRGTAIGQVIGICLLEGLIVGCLSMVIGAFLGERFAQVMGSTRSFLVWETRSFLPTALSWNTLRFGVVAVAASVFAFVLPVLNMSRATVVTYKQEQARSLKAPLWQRMFLDVWLAIPALYGYYLFRQRGALSITGKEGEAGSPFDNPLLFLVPVFFVFATALFSIRIFPLVMRFLAWIVNIWRGVVPVLVLRHLSRMARHYTGPLLLLILTLSLAVFTASMARTLDGYIIAKIYYEVGADFRLVEVGEGTQVGLEESGLGKNKQEGNEQKEEGPLWLFLPVSEHLNIPGVQAAARVWVKSVTAKLGGENVKGQMMGVDRIDFPQVCFFRSDFAPAALGALMNALAVRNDAILVNRDVFEEYGIEVGDKININIPTGTGPWVDLYVAGMVDRFPGLYPEDGPFFIGNLDHIFDLIGGVYPYDVWLKTVPSVNPEALTEGAKELGINVLGVYSAHQGIDKVQLEPGRQGVFGLLSIGFVVSALLTVLGFLIYSYISFRQRYIELGVLRAVGLSVGQMTASLIAEQLTLILVGVVVGTGLGVWAGRLFIPFLQVEGGAHPLTPPFVVQIAWTEIRYIYAVFGAMFLAASVVLFLSLRHMRIFEAIKLGETT